MNIVPRSLFVVCCLFGQACATWTFGMNNPNYVTITQKTGHILPLHKTTKIRLEEPPCFILKFVHVTVNNMISTPAVSFDKQTLTVSITYALLASSTSSYEVTAKGMRTRDCNEGNRVRNFQNGNNQANTNYQKLTANSNYQYYNEGENGISGGGGHAGDNRGSGSYAGVSYHEGASGNAGNGGGHVGGGGYTGNGNNGGGSGHAGYDSHGGAGGHAGGGGYEGSGNHGGTGGHAGGGGFEGSGNHGGTGGNAGGGGYEGSGNHGVTGGHPFEGYGNHEENSGGLAGSGSHAGNGGDHGGGGGHVGNHNYGGSGSHSEASIEIFIDEHYDIAHFHGTHSDNYYDTDAGIHINENADGTGKYSPNILDSNEYGWGSYQFLAGGKGKGKKALQQGKNSAAEKGLQLKHSRGKGRETSDSLLSGGSGFGGGSGYSLSTGYGGNRGAGSAKHSNKSPQRWWTSFDY